MPDPRMPQLQGNPIWFDLPTPDPEGAKRFYSGLFGWDWADVRMPGGSIYHMAIEGDANIVGMYQEQPDLRSEAGSKVWRNQIYVRDAYEIAERIVDQGGSIVVEPHDVSGIGVQATVATPEGAVFCLWQSVTGYGADIFAVPGSVCWIEYHSADVAAACDFYRDCFDVDFTEVTMPSEDPARIFGPLHLLTIDGEQMPCAFFQLEEGETQPRWATYFMVEDARTATRRAVELGAEVICPVRSVPPGTLASLKDPQGVRFSLWQSAG